MPCASMRQTQTESQSWVCTAVVEFHSGVGCAARWLWRAPIPAITGFKPPLPYHSRATAPNWTRTLKLLRCSGDCLTPYLFFLYLWHYIAHNLWETVHILFRNHKMLHLLISLAERILLSQLTSSVSQTVNCNPASFLNICDTLVYTCIS